MLVLETVFEALPTNCKFALGLTPPDCNGSRLCGIFVPTVLEEGNTCSFREGWTALLGENLPGSPLEFEVADEVVVDGTFCCCR